MTTYLDELRSRIAALSDDELVRMVAVDFDAYRAEALDFAQEEIRRRGIVAIEQRVEELRRPPKPAVQPDPNAPDPSAPTDAMPTELTGLESETRPNAQWGFLGGIGVLGVVAGVYLLINPEAVGARDVVSLQKLAMGQAFTIAGAVLIAAQWHARR